MSAPQSELLGMVTNYVAFVIGNVPSEDYGRQKAKLVSIPKPIGRSPETHNCLLDAVTSSSGRGFAPEPIGELIAVPTTPLGAYGSSTLAYAALDVHPTFLDLTTPLLAW